MLGKQVTSNKLSLLCLKPCIETEPNSYLDRHFNRLAKVVCVCSTLAYVTSSKALSLNSVTFALSLWLILQCYSLSEPRGRPRCYDTRGLLSVVVSHSESPQPTSRHLAGEKGADVALKQGRCYLNRGHFFKILFKKRQSRFRFWVQLSSY